MTTAVITADMAGRLHPHELAVLTALCWHTGTFGDCIPTRAMLAEETCISLRSVSRALARLEDAGLVTIESRTRVDGGKAANQYWVDRRFLLDHVMGGAQ